MHCYLLLLFLLAMAIMLVTWQWLFVCEFITYLWVFMFCLGCGFLLLLFSGHLFCKTELGNSIITFECLYSHLTWFYDNLQFWLSSNVRPYSCSSCDIKKSFYFFCLMFVCENFVICLKLFIIWAFLKVFYFFRVLSLYMSSLV